MSGTIKWRAVLTGVLFTLAFLALLVRLYWVQIANAGPYLDDAQELWKVNYSLRADRGAIYDRNGGLLAVDGAAYTVVVNPKLILEESKKRPGLEREVASKLSALIGKPERDILDRIYERKSSIWVELGPEGRKIDSEKAKTIREQFGGNSCREYVRYVNCKNYGVILANEKKRYYPAGTMLSHVLGFVNMEGQEGGGLELRFKDALRGTDGSISYAKDLKGVKLPDAEVTYTPPVHGKELRLTIDKQIQSFMETALKEAYDKWRPKFMTAIAADPKTMEILGMASYPTYDPNSFWQAESQDVFKNHAVQSEFEPGSTFKIVTLAAAIEEKVWNPDETFQSGSITVTGQQIHDHNRRGWGKITYRMGLLKSSNVAFVKLGLEKLGKEKLKEYIDKFGFGQKTGIELPAEGAGRVEFNYPVEVATAAFGQGITVTALQELTAAAAIANGGKLMKPYLVKEIVDPNTGERETFGPTEVRRVVSESTAKEAALLLEQVVADPEGTGRNADVDGYRVAGKTGTAQVVVGGKYASDRWIISFVGFAPVEDPKIALIVVADEPDIGSNYQRGGEVAAPVFQKIVSQAMQHLNVEPEAGAVRKGVEIDGGQTIAKTAPDVTGQPVKAATDRLKEAGIGHEVLGDGKTVIGQFPSKGTEIGTLQRMYLLTAEPGTLALPDMSGYSLRDALELCGWLGYRCAAEGEGYVAAQEVTEANGAKTVRLRLEPLSATESDAAKATAPASSAAPGSSPAPKQEDVSAQDRSATPAPSAKQASSAKPAASADRTPGPTPKAGASARTTPAASPAPSEASAKPR